MIFDANKGLENKMTLFEIGEQGLGMGHAHNLFPIYTLCKLFNVRRYLSAL